MAASLMAPKNADRGGIISPGGNHKTPRQPDLVQSPLRDELFGRQKMSVSYVQAYAKSLSSIVTRACVISSLARDFFRNSRDSAGSSVLVMMLSIMRPPESGSLHFETM